MPKSKGRQRFSAHRVHAAIGTLKVELSKALSCYERALFYATVLSPEASYLDAALSTIDSYIGYIFLAYIDAGALLIDRLTEITERYKNLRDLPVLNDANAIPGAKPDRDLEATIVSIEQVIRRRDRLISVAFATAENKKISIDDKIAELVRDWNGLDSISRLLMDEITFLSGRVDSFNSTLKTLTAIENSEKLVKEAKRSLRYAIVGIFITVFLTVTGIIIASAIGGVQIWIAKDGSTEKTETEILEKFNKLNLNQQPPPDAISSALLLANLKDQIANLQHTLDANTSQNPASIQEFRKKIDALSTAVSELKSSPSGNNKTSPAIINNNNNN